MPKEILKKECPICHKQKSIDNGFYKSVSPLFANDGCVPICISCVKKDVTNDDGTINLKKFKTMMQRLDKPLYWSSLESAYNQYRKEHGFISEDEASKHGKEIVGFYFKNLNSLRQLKNKSFADSEIDNFISQNSNMSKSEYDRINRKYNKVNGSSTESISAYNCDNTIKTDLKETQEVKWSGQDLKNKSYVLQSVGYDCFNDENYTEQNTKFLFNTMADYLTDDVLEDPHKMQRVISLVKTTLQLDSVDKLITSELKKQNPDNSLIKSFTDIKDKLERTINSSANENGISAKSSGKGSKGSNALTNIMKEMGENGFEEIKVNLVNIKLSESYKEISADNAKSLFNELNFTTDEFAKMVATQSEELIAYQDKIMKLEEDIRHLKVENKRLKCKITELGGNE